MTSGEWARIEAGVRPRAHPRDLAVATGDRASGVLATWDRWDRTRAAVATRTDAKLNPGLALAQRWLGAWLMRLGTRLLEASGEAVGSAGARATEPVAAP